MIYCVDIDNTICITYNSDYINSIPIIERINYINNLYDKGNRIIYFSARGSVSKKNLYDFTLKQLKDWKCKFHELILGKPNYDIMIDDKSENSERFFKAVL